MCVRLGKVENSNRDESAQDSFQKALMVNRDSHYDPRHLLSSFISTRVWFSTGTCPLKNDFSIENGRTTQLSALGNRRVGGKTISL